MINKKGGVFLEKDSTNQNALTHIHSNGTLAIFLRNCTFEYITEGSSGIIFKATLQEGMDSPYIELGFGTHGDIKKERRQILFKFCVLYETSEEIIFIDNNKSYTDDHRLKLYTVSEDSFETEGDLQSELYKTTNFCLESMVPYIFRSLILGKTDELYQRFEGVDILNERLFKYIETPELITYTSKRRIVIPNPELKIGVLVMATSADDINMTSFYDRIYNSSTISVDQHIRTQHLKCVGIESLLRFTVITGYVHGDHHFGNLLFSTQLSSYATKEQSSWMNNIRCYIIDFGRTKLVQHPNIEIIRRLCKEFLSSTSNKDKITRLTTLMEAIYIQGSSKKTTFDEYIGQVGPVFYGWIKDITPYIAETVYALIFARISKNTILRETINSALTYMGATSTSAYGNIGNKGMYIAILQKGLALDEIEEFLTKKAQKIRLRNAAATAATEPPVIETPIYLDDTAATELPVIEDTPPIYMDDTAETETPVIETPIYLDDTAETETHMDIAKEAVANNNNSEVIKNTIFDVYTSNKEQYDATYGSFIESLYNFISANLFDCTRFLNMDTNTVKTFDAIIDIVKNMFQSIRIILEYSEIEKDIFGRIVCSYFTSTFFNMETEISTLFDTPNTITNTCMNINAVFKGLLSFLEKPISDGLDSQIAIIIQTHSSVHHNGGFKKKSHNKQKSIKKKYVKKRKTIKKRKTHNKQKSKKSTRKS